MLSTTYTLPGNFFAARTAQACVPESLEDRVTAITSLPSAVREGKRLFKAIIADLAGLRDLVRLDEFFKKLPM